MPAYTPPATANPALGGTAAAAAAAVAVAAAAAAAAASLSGAGSVVQGGLA